MLNTLYSIRARSLLANNKPVKNAKPREIYKRQGIKLAIRTFIINIKNT